MSAEREAIARVIDPDIFRTVDNSAGFPCESEENYQNRRIAEAFAKADAVLALIARSPDVG